MSISSDSDVNPPSSSSTVFNRLFRDGAIILWYRWLVSDLRGEGVDLSPTPPQGHLEASRGVAATYIMRN